MASSLPIPAPPRTPTPPTPAAEEPEPSWTGLGINGADGGPDSSVNHDPNTLSPTMDAFPARLGSISSVASSASGAAADGLLNPPPRNPFNFKTETYVAGPVAKSVCAISDIPIVYWM